MHKRRNAAERHWRRAPTSLADGAQGAKRLETALAGNGGRHNVRARKQHATLSNGSQTSELATRWQRNAAQKHKKAALTRPCASTSARERAAHTFFHLHSLAICRLAAQKCCTLLKCRSSRQQVRGAQTTPPPLPSPPPPLPPLRHKCGKNCRRATCEANGTLSASAVGGERAAAEAAAAAEIRPAKKCANSRCRVPRRRRRRRRRRRPLSGPPKRRHTRRSTCFRRGGR